MTAESRGPNMFPSFRYADAPAAIEWLVDAFGFERQLVVDGPDGTIAHAQLSLGPGVIMLGSEREDDLGVRSPRGGKPVTSAVYVAIDDVDAHYARARAAGAEILRELADTEYGSREYGARDLEGNVWFFGTYRPDVA